MKNLQILNAFSHGQLQDFLTLKTVMDNHQLTFDDIKEAVKLKISGELETERPTEANIKKSLNVDKKAFANQILIGSSTKKIGSITNRFEIYKKIQPEYEGSLDDFKKLRKIERSKSLINTPKKRSP